MVIAGVFILHNSTRLYLAHAIGDIHEKYEWEVLFHPSYRHEMMPADFDLLPKLKKINGGERIQ